MIGSSERWIAWLSASTYQTGGTSLDSVESPLYMFDDYEIDRKRLDIQGKNTAYNSTCEALLVTSGNYK